MKKNEAKIIWFTGLSGVGKTTLSNKLYDILKKKNKILKLDGDKFRKRKKNFKNFSRKNILENNFDIIRYIGKRKNNFDYILVSVISPLIKTRLHAKKKLDCEEVAKNYIIKNKNLVGIKKSELKMLSTNFCYGGQEIYEIENIKN